jgi:ATP-dependent Clp protease ATP-binding subunit ClpA
MFERFSADARSAVVRAQVIAQETQAGLVEPAHLALAVAGDTSSAGARVLTNLGVDRQSLGDEIRRRAQHRDDLGGLTIADVDALSSLGVDATELIGRLGVPAGESGSTGRDSRRSRGAGGHIPFTPAAKAALERALREALRLNDKHIGTEHVLLGVVAVDRDVDAVLEAHGVTYADLFARIDGGA